MTFNFACQFLFSTEKVRVPDNTRSMQAIEAMERQVREPSTPLASHT